MLAPPCALLHAGPARLHNATPSATQRRVRDQLAAAGVTAVVMRPPLAALQGRAVAGAPLLLTLLPSR
jgi:hypothetical protein